MRTRLGWYGLGLLMALVSVGSNVMAGGVQVPEIDGNTLTTGLGLLTAGILVLRSRRQSK